MAQVMKARGTRQEVWEGIARATSGGLLKADLKKNSRGNLVSIKQSEIARARYPELKAKLCAVSAPAVAAPADAAPAETAPAETAPAEMAPAVAAPAETAEERAARIFAEDEEKRNREWTEEVIKQLPARRLKRLAVIEKHKAVLDASIVGKKKGIRFRQYIHAYVNMVANREFLTEDEEYEAIGKPGRLRWTDYESHKNVYNENDPMRKVIGEIMTEFGCFEY
jgi:hypothetical protein